MTKPINCPSQERIKEVLDYDGETGVFRWRDAMPNNANPRQIAGSKTQEGYIRIQIDGKSYAAHRLAYVYVNGVDTELGIYHINGIRDDNRIANLRPAQLHENHWNRGLMPNNTSGVPGVHYNKGMRKWRAACDIARKHHYLGSFATKDEAVTVLLRFKEMQQGEFLSRVIRNLPIDTATSDAKTAPSSLPPAPSSEGESNG